MAKKDEKASYKLLGNHNKIIRGSIIDLTDDEAKQSCFTNKLERIITPASSVKESASILEDASKKAEKIIIEAKKQAEAILKQSEQKQEKKDK